MLEVLETAFTMFQGMMMFGLGLAAVTLIRTMWR